MYFEIHAATTADQQLTTTTSHNNTNTALQYTEIQSCATQQHFGKRQTTYMTVVP